jgi:hypothetical protein
LVRVRAEPAVSVKAARRERERVMVGRGGAPVADEPNIAAEEIDTSERAHEDL